MALTDDLVAFWELDNVNDSHGSNHLTNNNTATFVSAKVGNGVDLEATSSQSLSIADNAALSLSADQAFTICFWYRPESNTDLEHVVSKDDGTTNREFGFVRDGSALYFYLWDSGGTQIITITEGTLTSTVNTWNFWCGGYDPVANVVFLVRDADFGTDLRLSASGGTRDQAAPFAIGGSTSQHADGIIDQVGFWKRVLSDAEITELYNSGSGLSYAAMSGGGGSEPARIIFEHA